MEVAGCNNQVALVNVVPELYTKKGQVLQFLPKCCIQRSMKYNSGCSCFQISKLFSFFHILWGLNVFFNGALLPYGGTTLQFVAVCFELTWQSDFGPETIYKILS